jgi:outer membrane biosynthesis protein TonB
MWIGEEVGVGQFSGINSVGVEKEKSEKKKKKPKEKKSQKEKPKEKKRKKEKGSGESGKNTNHRAKTSRGQSSMHLEPYWWSSSFVINGHHSSL